MPQKSIQKAFDLHKEYIQNETLCTKMIFGKTEGFEMDINEHKSNYWVEKSMKGISRSKAAHFFCNIAKHYFRVRSKLAPYQKEEFKNAVKDFDAVFEKNDRKEIRHQLNLLRNKSKRMFPKTYFRKVGVWVFGFVFAFFIAFGIRQMWLELTTVPTGSMRPTLKEQDRMLVSKSKFAINIPFTNGHLYFNKNLLKRLQVVVLSGNDLDIQDPWTLFLGIMPVKKTFIKRLVAFPGDTLYFYGEKFMALIKMAMK